MRGKPIRVTISSTPKQAASRVSKTAIARVAFLRSESEIDKGIFLICSEKCNQHAERDCGDDTPCIGARRKHMLPVGGLEMQVQQEEDCDIDREKLNGNKVFRFPLPSRKACELFPSARKRGNPKEDPGQTNEIEDDNSAAPACDEVGGGSNHLTGAHEQALDGQPGTVDSAPDDKSPVGAVPQTSKQHGEHQVDVGPDLSETAATERYVEIIAQPRT